MTLEAVAARAGVSKPTIHRRCPQGKAQLVAAAIAWRREAKPELPDTGSLRGDLLATVRHMVDHMRENAQLAAGLTHQLRTSPEPAEIFREHVIEPERARWTELLSPHDLSHRAARRGLHHGARRPRAASHPEPGRAPLDRGLLTVAAVVVLGAVMSILDTTVVNVAINTLAQDFSTTLPTIQWVVTGYTLALATVIPATGWAADRFGTKRLYLLSIALFLAGSLLSGIAWSAESPR